MSWLSSLFGGGGGSSTSTTTQQVPQWIENMIRNTASTGRRLSKRPYQLYEGPRIAGFTDDTLFGWDTARDVAGTARDAWTTAQGAAGDAMTSGAGARDVRGGGVGPLDQVQPGMQGSHLFSGTSLDPYMDPYTREVVDATNREINRAYDVAARDASDAAIATGAFGGSRHAILEAENERNRADAIGRNSASLFSSGFDRASALASRDVDRMVDRDRFNIGNEFAADQFNTGLDFQRRVGDVDRRMQADVYNQAADFRDADFRLGAGGLFGEYGDRAQGAGLQDAAVYESIGGQRRDLNQQALDLDYSDFTEQRDWAGDQFLKYRLPSTFGAPFQMFSSQTTTGPGQSKAGGIGSLLSGAASLFSLFSDRRLKVEIEPTGETIAGVPLYSYRYAWDEPGVRRVGVMADEAPAEAVSIEPWTGFAVVDYGVLMEAA